MHSLWQCDWLLLLFFVVIWWFTCPQPPLCHKKVTDIIKLGLEHWNSYFACLNFWQIFCIINGPNNNSVHSGILGQIIPLLVVGQAAELFFGSSVTNTPAEHHLQIIQFGWSRNYNDALLLGSFLQMYPYTDLLSTFFLSEQPKLVCLLSNLCWQWS